MSKLVCWREGVTRVDRGKTRQFLFDSGDSKGKVRVDMGGIDGGMERKIENARRTSGRVEGNVGN